MTQPSRWAAAVTVTVTVRRGRGAAAAAASRSRRHDGHESHTTKDDSNIWKGQTAAQPPRLPTVTKAITPPRLAGRGARPGAGAQAVGRRRSRDWHVPMTWSSRTLTTKMNLKNF